MPDVFFKDESYKLIGACMEVHNQLGMGFKEVIYKDAIEIEFNAAQIPFEREKGFKI
ncbi:MAG: GTP-binding signal recognition particle [Flaviaesturariibacter sp.]|nr:GTP-binding signal recognition particle [Flaviaesturariibacter sp.]